MLIKLEDPTILSKIVEIVSELVTEVKFKFNDAGMSMTAIDPANVAMVRFFISKNAFSHFETINESLGINLEDLKKILRRGGTRSSLIFSTYENKLNIEIQDRIKRNFRINLIEISKEEKEMPNMNFSAKVEMNSIDFVDVIEDCAVVADACSFIIKEGKFIIEAKEMNSARAEFSGDESKIEAENCKAKYSLEYLQKFIKGAKLSEKTKLSFAEDHPLRMDFNIQNIEISFLLAPRVETED